MHSIDHLMHKINHLMHSIDRSMHAINHFMHLMNRSMHLINYTQFEIFIIHFNPSPLALHDCSALTSTADLCFAWQGIQPTVLQLFLRYSFSRDLQCTNVSEFIS